MSTNGFNTNTNKNNFSILPDKSYSLKLCFNCTQAPAAHETDIFLVSSYESYETFALTKMATALTNVPVTNEASSYYIYFYGLGYMYARVRKRGDEPSG